MRQITKFYDNLNYVYSITQNDRITNVYHNQKYQTLKLKDSFQLTQDILNQNGYTTYDASGKIVTKPNRIENVEVHPFKNYEFIMGKYLGENQ